MSSFAEVWEEKLRTASPDSSASVDVQRSGAREIRAFWRVAAASGGSSDQTGNLKAEHSDNSTDWTDIPDGAFGEVGQGCTFPAEQTLTIFPTRRYLRWTMTHAGTTKSATWGLEVAYIS